MKLNSIKLSMALAMAAPLFSSCLQEFTPTSSVTQEQVDKADKEALVRAIPAYLNNYNSDYTYDIGYGGLVMWKDASTGDMPIYDNTYDYYWQMGWCESLSAQSSPTIVIFRKYYSLSQKCNLVIESSDPSNPNNLSALVMAKAYRAMAYFEAGQWFEYKRTGFESLDSRAQADGIYGLTVPIVTPSTTDAESRNNPRAPFWKLYRFVLTDLNDAEEYSTGMTEPTVKTDVGPGVVFGLQARLWLTLGTRFELHPEDLTEALAHEDDANINLDKLGITSARECFELAASYARKAINRGYTPLSESQWFDPTTGFNTPNNSWMWANIINSDNGLAKSKTWQSFASFISPEPQYGISTPQYNGYRMIDSRLYSLISANDWRKPTWIAPGDEGSQSAYTSKYASRTNLDFTTWSKYAAYTSFKYHPGGGNISASSVGNAVSIPMMRVEEMYLIEAEAVGRSQGDGAGRVLLEQFVNTYRFNGGNYKSTGAGIEGLVTDIFNQKRIEFWGEGIVLWDYRRLEKPVERGYPGTNWPAVYRFNSNINAVAPWTNLVIPQRECTYNIGIVNNPDASYEGNYTLWEE